MRIVCIVQARMGSTRLPGKVLMDIAGESMLAHVLKRVQRSKLITQVVTATTENPADDPVVQESLRLGFPVFRGSEEDVLDRYYQAAKEFHADVIVRVTSDCPLIDPEVVDGVIQAFLEKQPDYAANNFERKYPLGLDTEAVSFEALRKTWQQAKEPYQRSHVTYFMEENRHLFRLLSVVGDCDYSTYRWTVDTPEDMEFVRAAYEKLRPKGDFFSWREVISLIEREPALSRINEHVAQKPVKQG